MIDCDLRTLGYSATTNARIVRAEPWIWQAAVIEGVSPHLLNAIAWVESRFNPAAVSSAGAAGIFQLMPKTAAALAEKLAIVPAPHDPRIAAKLAAHFVRRLLARYDGNEDLAAAAYYLGPGRVKDRVPDRAKNYVNKVRKAKRQFQEAEDYCRGPNARPFDPGSTRPPRRKRRPTDPATPAPAVATGGAGLVVLGLLLAVALGGGS